MAAILAAAALTAWIPLSHRLTSRYFGPQPGPATPPAEAGVVEEVVIPADGGATLEGWWLRAPDGPGRAVVVVAHGNAYNLEKQWRFAAGLATRGFDVLVFDYRGFGDSTPLRTTRARARQDVVSAVAFARTAAAGRPLAVAGVSIGGALAIEALATDASAHGVSAIVADSPFDSWSGIAAWHLGRNRAGRAILRPLFAALLAPTGDDASECAARLDVPLLVISGSADEITLPHMARAITDAAGAKAELLSMDGAKHAGMRTKEEEARIADAEAEFLTRVLSLK